MGGGAGTGGRVYLVSRRGGGVLRVGRKGGRVSTQGNVRSRLFVGCEGCVWGVRGRGVCTVGREGLK